MPRCLWEPFYEEFARKLLEYKDNRETLIKNITVVYRNSGIPERYLPTICTDYDSGKRLKLGNPDIKDIDPFTVLRIFNTRLDTRANSRYRYIAMYYCSEQVRSVFQISSFFPVPNYDGYGTSSIYDNETTYGFGYIIQSRLIPSNVDEAWQFYENLLNHVDKPSSSSAKTLSSQLSYFDPDNRFLLKDPYRTYQLFWMAPETFVPLSPAVKKFVGNPNNGNVFTDRARELLETLTRRKTKFQWDAYFDFCNEIINDLKDHLRNIGDFVYDAEVAYSTKEKDSGKTKAPTKSQIIKALQNKGYSDINKNNMVYVRLSAKGTYDCSIDANLLDLDWYLVIDKTDGLMNVLKISRGVLTIRQLIKGIPFQTDKISFSLDESLNLLNNKHYLNFTHFIDSFITYEIDEKGDFVIIMISFNSDSMLLSDSDYSSYAKNCPDKERGFNRIYYGIPGCGKSYLINSKYAKDKEHCKRVVFHPDYGYSDFVGQLVPTTKDNGDPTYKFSGGPFVQILKDALHNLNEMYYLVIEEINRGNAPAIFGDLFQLLDRDENGVSVYSITNSDVAKELGLGDDSFKLPSNLSIIATMNTADQNIFTLDTAFKRRWEMEYVVDEFKKKEDGTYECAFAETEIGGTGVTWHQFHDVINTAISQGDDEIISFEDKRLGVWFASETDLKDINKFTNKVIRYLWDDVARLNTNIFKDGLTYDQICQMKGNDDFLTSVFNVTFEE